MDNQNEIMLDFFAPDGDNARTFRVGGDILVAVLPLGHQTDEKLARAKWLRDFLYSSPGLLRVMRIDGESGVTPIEWISALLSDYKTLLERAEELGYQRVDPSAEDLMMSEVSRFLRDAERAIESALSIERVAPIEYVTVDTVDYTPDEELPW